MFVGFPDRSIVKNSYQANENFTLDRLRFFFISAHFTQPWCSLTFRTREKRWERECTGNVIRQKQHQRGLNLMMFTARSPEDFHRKQLYTKRKIEFVNMLQLKMPLSFQFCFCFRKKERTYIVVTTANCTMIMERLL